MRNVVGYLLGFLMFVVGIPSLMWWLSGMPDLWPLPLTRGILAGLMMIGGLGLAVWTIIYMKTRGKGNPMDAFLAIMLVQVLSEEKCLRRDFGEEYEDYCKRTRRF